MAMIVESELVKCLPYSYSTGFFLFNKVLINKSGNESDTGGTENDIYLLEFTLSSIFI